MEILKNHDWDGNVRELENTLQEAVVLTKEDVLEKEYLFLRNSKNNIDYSGKENMSLVDIEKEHIQLILKKVNWDKQEACRILKISRPTLNKKIKDNNIESPKNIF